MAGLLKGLQELGAAVGRGTSLHGRVGFHAWKARAKMNKLSNAPSLMGHDQFGNAYYEDKTESFGIPPPPFPFSPPPCTSVVVWVNLAALLC
jgi:hypothetical protein